MRNLLSAFSILLPASLLYCQPTDYLGESFVSAEVFFQQGVYYHDEGNPGLAAEYYAAALEADERRCDAHYNLALAHYQMNNFGKAELALEKLLSLHPDDLGALELLGLSRYHRSAFDRAVAAYDAILAKEPKEEVYVYRALAHSAAGRHQQALLDFDRALKLNPQNFTACLGKGNTLLELGQLALSIAWFDRALEFSPNDAITLSNRSIALFKIGNLDAALSGWEQALQLDKLPAIYLARANCKTEAGDIPGAMTDIRAALAFAPDDPEVYYSLGLLELKNGNCRAAAESFDVTLDFKPSSALYLTSRAKAFLACGFYYQAIEDLRFVLSSDPANQEAGVLLHNAYQQLDKKHLDWMTADKQ